jgi:hypothetical protein
VGIYPDWLKTVDPETVKRRLSPLAVKNTCLCSSRHLWKPCLVLAVLVVGLKYFHSEKACQDGGTLSSVVAQRLKNSPASASWARSAFTSAR